MGDARIKVAKDKAELVQQLLASSDTTGPFQTYADIIAFAASLGFEEQRRTAINGEISKRDPAPIHRETFAAKGYEMILNLIAIAELDNPEILSSEEFPSTEKLKIFEEYVNGGLEILSSLMQGTIDYSEKILLKLQSESEQTQQKSSEFDLSDFL